MKAFTIERMKPSHLDGVCQVEESVFSIPWSKMSFAKELENQHAYYFVAIADDTVVGFAGMWHIVNEGHITNVGVLPSHQGMGIGKALCAAMFAKCEELEMIGITLEVRISNTRAQTMYTKLGFKPEGIRKKYYEDTKEDAIIMWKTFDINPE